MASRSEQAMTAVRDKVVAALPNAEVKRNPTKAVAPGAGGTVVIRDGDPGEPEIDLSPLMYHYERRMTLELLPPPSAVDPEAALDEMLGAIGAAFAADPTLGGLVDWARPEAATLDDIDLFGAPSGGWANSAILVAYSTTDPLN